MGIVLCSFVSSCSQQEKTKRELYRRNTVQSTNADNAANIWTGFEPIEKIITTTKPVDTIVIIDTGPNMSTEASYGLLQMLEKASQKPDQSNIESDYSVLSKDYSYMVVNEQSGQITDGQRSTVVNIPVQTENILIVLEEILNGTIAVTPQLRQESVKNIVLITDQDPDTLQIQRLQSYLLENHDLNEVYFHTISPRTTSQPNFWCQFENPTSALFEVKKDLQLKGLELDICNPDWHGLFQLIGQQMAYDWAIIELKMPTSMVIEEQSIYLQVDGITLPPKLYWYHQESHAMRMKLIDAPPSFSLIEAGYY